MQGRRARRWLIVSSVVALAATGVPQPAFAAPPPGDGPGLVEGFRNFLGLDEDDTEAAEPPALPDTGVPRNDHLPKGRDAAPAKRIKELEDRRTPNARYWRLSDGRVSPRSPPSPRTTGPAGNGSPSTRPSRPSGPRTARASRTPTPPTSPGPSSANVPASSSGSSSTRGTGSPSASRARTPAGSPPRSTGPPSPTRTPWAAAPTSPTPSATAP